MKLLDWLPHDFSTAEYRGERVCDLLNIEVIKEYSLFDEDDWKSWPGRHRNVMNWCVLATGHAVGFNENPSLGWAFPVIKNF